MKATGIVRRIDDLGRVVLPKEIRRFMRIREGDALEIFTFEGGIILRKHSLNHPYELEAIADEMRDDAHNCNCDDERRQSIFDIAHKLYEVAKEIRELEAE